MRGLLTALSLFFGMFNLIVAYIAPISRMSVTCGVIGGACLIAAILNARDEA